MRPTSLLSGILLLVALAPLAARASQTDFWQISTFRGFLQGNLQGVSVSMNGELTLAPGTEAIFNPNETVALSMVADRAGNLYVGTGHQGKIFKVNNASEGKLFFQAPEPEILALAIGPGGDLYAGTSPEGKIYRIAPDGKSSVFYQPKVKYIWALAFDSQGRLYAGTGDRGEVLRIDPDGKESVFFPSNQTHIMCLAFDKHGNLLAGSEPNGLIYRINPEGKAFVLYQSNLPEIHSLVTDSQGRIYAAALGNSGPGGTPGYFGAPNRRTIVPGGTTTVTVVAADSTEGAAGAQLPLRRAPPRANPNASGGVEFPYSRIGAGRGALVEIMPDYSAQTLWQSNRSSIFGLALRGGDVLFSTDDDGRIFDLKPSRTGAELTLLTETRESLPTRILADSSGLFVATSNIAKLIRVGSGYGDDGVYESPVKDARFISRWGHIAWRAQVSPECSLEFYTRSGNSERPDNTWSNWAGPYKVALGSAIKSTPARYLQWKAVFHGSGGASPSLNQVEISYLNQNLPPQIESLTVVDGSERTSMSGMPIESPGAPVNSAPMPAVTTTTIVQPSYGGVGPIPDPPGKQPIELEWQASDPNHDSLTYALYLKSANEKAWHLLKDKLRAAQYTLQPDSLADGEYRVRLVASDAPSNPAPQALAAELVSAPFWVDNTPPHVVATGQDVNGHQAVIHFEATSKGAPIRSAQVSIGESGWKDVVSDEGIVDSRVERFTLRLDQLESGEQVVSLRAYDTAGNVGVGSAVIEVP
ncbi:MAG: hypothetical protein ACRD3D_15455 [Terriglobia bacterium]